MFFKRDIAGPGTGIGLVKRDDSIMSNSSAGPRSGPLPKPQVTPHYPDPKPDPKPIKPPLTWTMPPTPQGNTVPKKAVDPTIYISPTGGEESPPQPQGNTVSVDADGNVVAPDDPTKVGEIDVTPALPVQPFWKSKKVWIGAGIAAALGIGGYLIFRDHDGGHHHHHDDDAAGE